MSRFVGLILVAAVLFVSAQVATVPIGGEGGGYPAPQMLRRYSVKLTANTAVVIPSVPGNGFVLTGASAYRSWLKVFVDGVEVYADEVGSVPRNLGTGIPIPAGATVTINGNRGSTVHLYGYQW